MRGRCATGAVSNTFAISVAQNTLPHSVPPANLKHTPSKQAFQPSLHKPVTPVKVDRLNFLLSGYETSLRLYLVNGFTFGFRVGFDGERCALHSPNLKSALDQPQIVRTKLRKECEAGRICGPFICPPFPNFVCSPLGIVPKKDPSEFRLIQHLSYPQGTSLKIKEEQISVVLICKLSNKKQIRDRQMVVQYSYIFLLVFSQFFNRESSRRGTWKF